MKQWRQTTRIIAILLSVSPTLAVAAGKAEAQQEDHQRAMIQKWIYEVFNDGDFDLIPEMAQPDLIVHAPPSDPETIVGLEGLIGFFQALHSGYSDLQTDLVAVFSDGDFAVASWTLTRTHTGELFGIPPTGKTIVNDAMTVYRFHEGKIAEIWLVEDTQPFLRSIGALPEG